MERWRQKELAKFYENKKLLEEYAKEHPEVYQQMFANIPEVKDFDKMFSAFKRT